MGRGGPFQEAATHTMELLLCKCELSQMQVSVCYLGVLVTELVGEIRWQQVI